MKNRVLSFLFAAIIALLVSDAIVLPPVVDLLAFNNENQLAITGSAKK